MRGGYVGRGNCAHDRRASVAVAANIGRLAIRLSALVLSVISCEVEEKPLNAPVIQFETSFLSVAEGSDTVVTLTLSSVAWEDVTIDIGIVSGGVYGKDFQTTPEATNNAFELEIGKGGYKAEFTFSAIDNDLIEMGKATTFKIDNVSGSGVTIGSNASLFATIEDDEGPSFVNFKSKEDSVDENNASGIVVQMFLTRPAVGTGTFTISIEDKAYYGKDYITVPAAENGNLVFDVSENQKSLNFSVLPINNDYFTDNRKVSFSIVSATGVLRAGSNQYFSLTIKNDDPPAFANFFVGKATVNENDGDGISVEIPFTIPTELPAKLKILVFPDGKVVYGRDFTTEPAGFGGQITLELVKGQTSANFKIIPIDNLYSNYDRDIGFELNNSSEGIKVGGKNSFRLTIVDDEIAEGGFADQEGTISEGMTSGVPIRINFSKPLAQVTSFVIYEANNLYGKSFQTSPEMTGNTYTFCPCGGDWDCSCAPGTQTDYYLNLVVPKGATSAEFVVMPIDDAVQSNNRRVVFHLYATDESPTIITGSEYALTIEDND